MVSRDDISTSKRKGEESDAVARYHTSRHAWISVEQRDGGFNYDAGVTPSEVQRIAKLGQLPNDQSETLAEWLSITLAYQAIIQDQRTSRHFTRREGCCR
jgi:hypothetical protein